MPHFTVVQKPVFMRGKKTLDDFTKELEGCYIGKWSTGEKM